MAEILDLLKSKQIERQENNDGSTETMLARFERSKTLQPPANLIQTEDVVNNQIPEIVINDEVDFAEEPVMEIEKDVVVNEPEDTDLYNISTFSL